MTIDSTLMATVVFLLSSGMVAIAQQTPEKFAAATVTRTGHLTFDAPVEKVFPLFTPLGERNWAPGWNPEILYPADGTPTEGLLFRTEDHGGMVWWLTHYDPAHFAIGYHAVAPVALARHIEIQCRAAGGRTEVTVTDTYIGLSDHGNHFVKSLDDAAYAGKMKGWQQRINDYLTTGPSPNK